MRNLLVIFGGRSTEHEVSCMSAGNVIDAIDSNNKYKVSKLGITKDGKWIEYTGNNSNIKKNKWLNDIKNLKLIDNITNYLKQFDVVFPVLHGKYGEDGTIQGMLDIINVKYVGCDCTTSSIGMNKMYSKILAANYNIPIVEYIPLRKYEYELQKNDNFRKLNEKIYNKLGYPVIIKPNNGGSSVGTVKVKETKDLQNALNEAFKYDDMILIEKCIDAKEIECAVLQKNKNSSDYIISNIGEIIPSNEFYDYDAKYYSNKSICKIPADIDDDIRENIRKYAKIFACAINVKGLSRIDFFVSKTTNNIYFNEINTMPGFTDISMYPKLIENYGIKYNELINMLIEMAI